MVTAGAELVGAFKSPSLRHIGQTGSCMHAGQFGSLDQVLHHYNQAPAAPIGRTELRPLDLSLTELAELKAFLHSLSGPVNAPPELRLPPGRG